MPLCNPICSMSQWLQTLMPLWPLPAALFVVCPNDYKPWCHCATTIFVVCPIDYKPWCHCATSLFVVCPIVQPPYLWCVPLCNHPICGVSHCATLPVVCPNGYKPWCPWAHCMQPKLWCVPMATNLDDGIWYILYALFVESVAICYLLIPTGQVFFYSCG